MNGVMRNSGARRIGFLAVLLLSAVSLKADPVAIGEGPPRPEAVIPIILAVLMEAICIQLMLRRWRRPALFILWLMGMHLLTYPLFLWVLWLSWGLHPALGVTMGEGAIVLVEGGLIYLLCRFISSAKSELPVPSIAKCLFASVIGNICSAVAFPLMIWLYQLAATSMGVSVLD
ncbi:MAG: hypothetical protein ACLPRE_08055 [Limisphaerales bacterium]